jgi:hypothetical protein
MSREITDHKLNGLNEAIKITALDAPGPGGANHRYALTVYPKSDAWIGETVKPAIELEIVFQNGPVGEAGFNGLSNEALLAVLIDRMRGFQGMLPRTEEQTLANLNNTGVKNFACRENAIALTHLEEALMWLQKRTRDRMARGVEGTMAK